MRPLVRFGFLALAAGLATGQAVRAEVVVCTPWVTVQVGRPPGQVVVAVPGVGTVAVPVRRAAAAPPAPVTTMPPAAIQPGDPPPVPLEGAPRVVIPSPTTTPAATVGRVPTVSEFLAAFKPRAGVHQVTVQHPFTGAPVQLSLVLPAGSPSRIRANRRVVEFDYGRRVVVVRFFRDGSVQVRN
jgi:hypothetical protein